MEFQLKDGMLLGTATAATQIEGGNLNHSWNNWYQMGKIKDQSNPERANQHYEKYPEDIALMKQMGLKIYRLGIEWARIEPKEGRFDASVIEHYRNLISLLKAADIKPLLTLHHFTNPGWFEEKGAFTKTENIPMFLAFVKVIVENLGDLVNEYITINEPNIYATGGYFTGDWPPGEKSFKATIQVMSVMTLAHIKAYLLIHQIRDVKGMETPDSITKVSFANHVRVFEPENKWNPVHIFYAKATKRIFQGAITKAMFTGKITWPLKKLEQVQTGYYGDFIGINYYSRSTVSGLRDGTKKGVPINDLGWEIYPQGIVEVAQEIYKKFQKPIYITENGICDNQDRFRSKYIYDHLKAISESDLPIIRYYHWSFTDNFEWIEGESARFGLVHVDYETQIRTIKESGDFYSEVIRNHGVTQNMYDTYIKNKNYFISK